MDFYGAQTGSAAGIGKDILINTGGNGGISPDIYIKTNGDGASSGGNVGIGTATPATTWQSCW